ncbi:hypothetical protein [Telmatospirillum sp.]|uniref:hypothetical protein n=1 Tax=Telmatospirillum sp. TaxID=2079197 RepID=UPI00284EDCDB|nr:hypothetical protein [Telmatospirillum sp.]MDR3437268.1 hypothetical protein [Telmatospirillum sp.]
MKKLSFAHDDFPDLGLFRHGLAVREIEWIVPEDLAVVDLIELYLEIDSAFSIDRGVVIQFIGASAGPGATEVALDMAWTAVSILGKKVLVLNCTQSQWTRALDHKADLQGDAAIHPISVHDDLMKVAGHEMYMADLKGWSGQSDTLAKTSDIKGPLEESCRYFDMVVMVAPPADSEPLGTILSGQVDGNILVIEAEQTRRSAAIRLREILSRCHRPMLGAVLHDRQNHIPHWMARFL